MTRSSSIFSHGVLGIFKLELDVCSLFLLDFGLLEEIDWRIQVEFKYKTNFDFCFSFTWGMQSRLKYGPHVSVVSARKLVGIER